MASFKTGFVFAALFLLLLSNRVIAEDSSAAEKDYVLRIVTSCRWCPSASDIQIFSSIHHPDRKPIQLTQSTLVLMNSQGKVLRTFENPFHDNFSNPLVEGNRYSNVNSNELRRDLAGLERGEYWLIWTVNKNLKSNRVKFSTLNETEDKVPSLYIEPLEKSNDSGNDPAFLAYFVNKSPESIDLSAAWASATVWIDGKDYRLQTIFWSGSSSLNPNSSWATVVDLDLFIASDGVPVEPGVHKVQFEMLNSTSNEFDLEVTRRTATGAQQ